MPNEIRGSALPSSARFAIVVSRYNETITSKLLAGAVERLKSGGVPEEHIDVTHVPGAFEIPLVAQTLALSRRYVAVLCLGAVIRGETTHDQHINRALSVGLTEAALQSGVPVLFGVLTCDNLEQALNRAGGSVGHKGIECAEAALEMAGLMAHLKKAKLVE